MIFSWIGRRIADHAVDNIIKTVARDTYTENLFELFTTTRKFGLINLVETDFRAVQGKPPARHFGSVVALSPWDKLLFNPVHLWRLPTPENTAIDTSVVIGPAAEKPLRLQIPILIAGMSFGSALSEQVKIALARATGRLGTATNTGEAGLLPSERKAAKYLIGQYNRGGWLNSPDKLRQLDAVEVQLGQGAQAAVPQRTLAKDIGPDFRRVFGLAEGEDAVIHSRLPGINAAEDFLALIPQLKKEAQGIPVGLKLCATHHLERELEIAVKAGVDFLAIDGHEGGTHGGSSTIQDDMGLPTLVAVARAARYLKRSGADKHISLIASGGLRTPGQMLKAIALGADAVAIGTAAILALAAGQTDKTVPFEPPTELVFYSGRLKERFDIETGTESLVNYLKTVVLDMKHVVMALGKTAVSELAPSDLVALDRDLAYITGVDYAYLPPEEQWLLSAPIRLTGLDGANVMPADGVAVESSKG